MSSENNKLILNEKETDNRSEQQTLLQNYSQHIRCDQIAVNAEM